MEKGLGKVTLILRSIVWLKKAFITGISILDLFTADKVIRWPQLHFALKQLNNLKQIRLLFHSRDKLDSYISVIGHKWDYQWVCVLFILKITAQIYAGQCD